MTEVKLQGEIGYNKVDFTLSYLRMSSPSIAIIFLIRVIWFELASNVHNNLQFHTYHFELHRNMELKKYKEHDQCDTDKMLIPL